MLKDIINYANIIEVKTWEQLLNLYIKDYSTVGTWAFRGQSNIWPLKTSLERALNSFCIDLENAKIKELGLLRRFQRQYSHFQQSQPDKEDYWQWFSIMQHYGCPTRFLDFTYSFFIAAYFSIYKCEKESKPCIWVINRELIINEYLSICSNEVKELRLNDDHIKYKSTMLAILKENIKAVIDVNPFYLNERLVLQQGLFLIPIDITSSFEANILDEFQNENIKNIIHLVKIQFDIEQLIHAIGQLHSMNIRYSTLFPGLGGFSEYLRTLIPLNDIFLSINKPEY